MRTILIKYWVINRNGDPEERTVELEISKEIRDLLIRMRYLTGLDFAKARVAVSKIDGILQYMVYLQEGSSLNDWIIWKD